MGNKQSRVIEVNHIEEELQKCSEIDQKDCSAYGPLHFVRYNQMEFYLGESSGRSSLTPHHLHWLVPPNLLVIPQFTLLEHTKPRSLDELLEIISGVAEFANQAGDLSIGHNRIAHAGRWGIVGQKSLGWTYNQIYADSNAQGIYLAPELMTELSQGRMCPKYDRVKADVFSFGMILLEIMFQESLTPIFDYDNFQIRLKPLLEKLNIVRQNFGDHLYNIILRMVELDPEERADYSIILDMLNVQHPEESQFRISQHLASSNYSSSSSRVSKPRYRNDCSPLKAGRTPERLGKTPERSRQPLSNAPAQIQQYRQQAPQINRSPIKRDLRINPVYDKENVYYPHSSARSPLRKREASPLSRRMF